MLEIQQASPLLFFLDSAGTETDLLTSGGEANTSSNLGTGEGLATAKVGVDLPFKSLIGGAGITLSSTGTEITITATGAGTGTIRLIKLEGATVSTDREGLNFSDTSTINFTVTDDAGNDEADVIAAIVNDSVVNVQIGAHTSTKITITNKSQLNSAIVYNDQDNTFLTNTKQTFTHQASKAGIALAAVAGDVSAPNNGEFWYNLTSNKFRARENGATVDMIGGGGSQTPWLSDIDAATNSLNNLDKLNFDENADAGDLQKVC